MKLSDIALNAYGSLAFVIQFAAEIDLTLKVLIGLAAVFAYTAKGISHLRENKK